jgi:glyoxalase family protein
MSSYGIHHVTAIAGSARGNIDFYTRILGLRLVKKTVNLDDPSTYHFYYGDEIGRPGSLLTFFPWDHVPPGRMGVGETQEAVLRVPQDSLGFWTHRFVAESVAHQAPEKRFGETILPFKDADGMRLALIGLAGIEKEPAWSTSAIPTERAIRGLHSVSLLLADPASTGAILSDVLGFVETARDDSLTRYRASKTMLGGIVDLRAAPGFMPSRQGAGSVHHLAFRAADDAMQAKMVNKLIENHHIHTTAQKDRHYFRSVYFREPGHVLFEIATDDPGFSIDEPTATLGEALKLPGYLESSRAEIEAVLLDIAPRPPRDDSSG